MDDERGQAAILLVGLMLALALGASVLAAYGQAIGARGKHQRLADLAVMSAARVMRTTYPRLFEPPTVGGVPNPHRMTKPQYLALARAAAGSAAVRNGVRLRPGEVTFPDGWSFAPTRVRVTLRPSAAVSLPGAAARGARFTARATAAIQPRGLGGGLQLGAATATGGGYGGPLAWRMGKPMRPDVAAAFDELSAGARRSGVALIVTSGFRSDAEQARLFAANPNPRWVAPPGRSLHRMGTELDLGPPSAYGWLERNAPRFGFVKRYAWEPWHFGFGTARRGAGRTVPGAQSGEHGVPAFVPPRFAGAIARASRRWNVPAELLAAQLYAESNFNPFAESPAGARGIAQFMPATARSYGLDNPYDPNASIEAQARYMRHLLDRFGTPSLALAAYNAGPGSVAKHGGIPPFAETQAYVARVLGLMSGAGGGLGELLLGIRLVE